MKFIDEINFYVSSGKSGDGLFSFSRFKRPDGGNGGMGGNVYLICDRNVYTFYHLKFVSVFKAENGENGKKNNKTGRSGKSIFIKVPIGTIVHDVERSIYLGELKCHGDKLLVVNSGKAGYGNFYLKNKAVIFSKLRLGSKQVLKYLKLELNLLADVGMLGFPNVGKSLFINNISNVYSRVGSYSFTTLMPVLGSFKDFKNIVVADIPGILEFSSRGIGLGFRFLKHLLRTRLLLHFIDSFAICNRYRFFKDIFIINRELREFDNLLRQKKKWLVFNKNDLLFSFLSFLFLKFFLRIYGYEYIFVISAKRCFGLKKLQFNINEYLRKI